MAFKTQAEIYQALLDGKMIKYKDGDGAILQLINGFQCENGRYTSSNTWSFNYPGKWSIYEEPKPKKKVTLYRYTYRTNYSPDIMQTGWVSCGFEGNYPEYYALLKAESKEVEYDDV